MSRHGMACQQVLATHLGSNSTRELHFTNWKRAAEIRVRSTHRAAVAEHVYDELHP